MTTSLLKSPQVTRIFLSILADLNNPIVSIVSNRPLIFCSFGSFSHAFSDCTKSTNNSWYNRYFHAPQFFQILSKVQVLILLFTYFRFYRGQFGQKNTQFWIFLFFFFFFLLLLIIKRSDRLDEIRWSVCISEFQGIYDLFAWSNLNLMLSSQWIILTTESCLPVLICCTRLCDWSFRLFHHITYISCFVGSYLFLLWYV